MSKMYPVESTTLILALKVCQKPFDKRWVNWATEMLIAGFETPHLLMLAAEFEPFNQFRMEEITSKVLHELGYDFSDRTKAVKDYVNYILDCIENSKLTSTQGLHILYSLYYEEDCPKYLQNFYFFYLGKVEMQEIGIQLYVEDCDDIDQAITDYFTLWKVENGYI